MKFVITDFDILALPKLSKVFVKLSLTINSNLPVSILNQITLVSEIVRQTALTSKHA